MLAQKYLEIAITFRRMSCLVSASQEGIYYNATTSRVPPTESPEYFGGSEKDSATWVGASLQSNFCRRAVLGVTRGINNVFRWHLPIRKTNDDSEKCRMHESDRHGSSRNGWTEARLLIDREAGRTMQSGPTAMCQHYTTGSGYRTTSTGCFRRGNWK